MDVSNLLAFIAVALFLVVSPGPNGLLITKTVPLSGRRAGLANICGFVVAFYVHGTLSIMGISVLLVQSGQAFLVFKLLGAAYLIYIGIKSLISAFKKPAAGMADSKITEFSGNAKHHVSFPAAFLEGFLTNALNPKVSMFYLAAFPQFISVGESVMNAYVLVTAHAVANGIWFSMMVFMLSRMARVAGNERFRRWLNAVTGAIFIGFGAKLAFMKGN